MPTAVPIAPCARLKCPVPLVQICVKSWRIEAGNLNAEGPLVSAEVRQEFATN
jgi:hypothetical protein